MPQTMSGRGGLLPEPKATDRLLLLEMILHNKELDPHAWKERNTDNLVQVSLLLNYVGGVIPRQQQVRQNDGAYITVDMESTLKAAISSLIGQGYLANDRDGRRNAFHVACTAANPWLARALISGGADPMLENEHGRTGKWLFHHTHGGPDEAPAEMHGILAAAESRHEALKALREFLPRPTAFNPGA